LTTNIQRSAFAKRAIQQATCCMALVTHYPP
jgi:hypothetical protein